MSTSSATLAEARAPRGPLENNKATVLVSPRQQTPAKRSVKGVAALELYDFLMSHSLFGLPEEKLGGLDIMRPLGVDGAALLQVPVIDGLAASALTKALHYLGVRVVTDMPFLDPRAQSHGENKAIISVSGHRYEYIGLDADGKICRPFNGPDPDVVAALVALVAAKLANEEVIVPEKGLACVNRKDPRQKFALRTGARCGYLEIAVG